MSRQALITAVEGYLEYLEDSSKRLGTEEFRQHQFRIVTIACGLVEMWKRGEDD